MSFFINNEKALALVLIVSTVAVFTLADPPPDPPHQKHYLQLEQGRPLDAEHQTCILSSPGGKAIHVSDPSIHVSEPPGLPNLEHDLQLEQGHPLDAERQTRIQSNPWGKAIHVNPENESQILITRKNGRTLGDLELSGEESLHSQVLEHLPDDDYHGLREQEGDKDHLAGRLESPIKVHHPELLGHKVQNHEPLEYERHRERLPETLSKGNYQELLGRILHHSESAEHAEHHSRHLKSLEQPLHDHEKGNHGSLHLKLKAHLKRLLEHLRQTHNRERLEHELHRLRLLENSKRYRNRKSGEHESDSSTSSGSSDKDTRDGDPWGYRSHSGRQSKRLGRNRSDEPRGDESTESISSGSSKGSGQEPWEHQSSRSSSAETSGKVGDYQTPQTRRSYPRLRLKHLRRNRSDEPWGDESTESISLESSEEGVLDPEYWRHEAHLLRLLEYFGRAYYARESQTQPRKMCECPKPERDVQEYHYEPLKNETNEGVPIE